MPNGKVAKNVPASILRYRLQAMMIAVLLGFLALGGAGLAAPQAPHGETTVRAVDLGGGTYRVTASVFAEGTDGQVGTQASSGHWIQPNDNLVALPACTESSCPWVPTGTGVEGRYGPQSTCAESDGLCWVKIVSDTTGECTVAPVHDRGPLFVRDNWWAAQSLREYSVPKGIPAAEYARDGVNFGFGAGISDVGHDIQNVYRYAAGIDLAGGTWKAIGLPISAGISKVTVTMLWQAGITHHQACSGSPSPTGITGTVFDGGLNLRSSASLGSSVLRVIPNGAVVGITGQSSGGFLSVSYQGTSGWAAAEFIDLGGPAPRSGASARVIDGSLNLRNNASTGSTVLRVMPEGSNVTLSGQSYGGFLGVIFQGVTGWAFAPYLTGSGTSGSGATATVIDGALNLRASASTNSTVLDVMPDGATVSLLGPTSNGFSQLSFQGTTGWAYSLYLSTGGSPSGPTTTVVDGPLNLRAGASTGYDVLAVMPEGATVTLLGSQSNGFTRISYQGTIGWAASEYLAGGSSSGNTATVIDGALNLRQGASTGYDVILVMPDNATVTLLGATANGYSRVSYQGTIGWAYSTYLSTGSSSSGGTATVIDGALNLRARASMSSSVLLVMPDGATVSLNGATQNGYTAVTYSGISGWAYSLYLD
ncbi:hypothetical protein BH20CHL4_BH20CHL4_07060 [soil metagenome]